MEKGGAPLIWSSDVCGRGERGECGTTEQTMLGRGSVKLEQGSLLVATKWRSGIKLRGAMMLATIAVEAYATARVSRRLRDGKKSC